MTTGEATHFVAIEGEDIAAMAGGFIKSDLPYCYFKKPRYGFVGDVYTKPRARRRGLAKGLSELVLGWCWEQDVDTVRLVASEAGRPMYAALGFVDRGDGASSPWLASGLTLQRTGSCDAPMARLADGGAAWMTGGWSESADAQAPSADGDLETEACTHGSHR